MAIILNKVELDLTGSLDKGTVAEREIKKVMYNLRKQFEGRFPLKFRYDDKMVTTGTKVDGDFRNPVNVPVYPTRPIPLTAEVIFENQRMPISYAKTVRWNESKQKNILEPKNLDFKGSVDVGENDLDLAFFLLYIQPNMGNAFENAMFKRADWSLARMTAIYKFIDDQKAATALVAKERLQIEVKNLIYNVMTNDHVKAIALKNNMMGAESQYPDTLRISLYNTIVAKADKAESYENIYADFIANYNELFGKKEKITTEAPAKPAEEEVSKPASVGTSTASKELEVKALISKAIEKKVLMEYGKDNTNFSYKNWSFVNDGKKGTKICSLVDGQNPIDTLYKAIVENPDIEKAIKEMISEKE